MRRIKLAEGGVADPVTGKIVFPQPPAAGTLEPSLLNAWQEELAGVVEAAGLTLSDSDNAQLLKALKKLHAITANTTINVPADQPTIEAALDSLVGRWIAPTAVVTIKLANGDYSLTRPLRVLHPQGKRIVIQGNIVSPAQVRIAPQSYWEHNEAVLAEAGEKVTIQGCQIQDVFVRSWANMGCRARGGGHIDLKYCIVINFAGSNIFAELGGSIYADQVVLQGSNASTLPGDLQYEYGHGAFARFGGSIYLTQCSTYTNDNYALHANSGGIIKAVSCTFFDAPVAATDNSIVTINNCNSTPATTYVHPVELFASSAFYVSRNSKMTLDTVTVTGAFRFDNGVTAEYNSDAHLEAVTINNVGEIGVMAWHGCRVFNSVYVATTVNGADSGYFANNFCYMGGNMLGSSTPDGLKFPPANTATASTLTRMD